MIRVDDMGQVQFRPRGCYIADTNGEAAIRRIQRQLLHPNSSLEHAQPSSQSAEEYQIDTDA